MRAVGGGIADLYVADGYARPEIRPDQSLLAHGILGLDISEPYIARVTIEGTPGRHRDAIETIAARLRESRPLRRDAIPEALAAMRRIPGLTVTPSTARDGAVPGAYELKLQAEFKPVAGAVHVNNRGTDQIGPHFVLGQVAVNDAFGWNEKIGLTLSAAVDTEEYLGAGLYFDAPIGNGGARGMAMNFRSESAPNEAPVNLSDEYLRERIVLRFTRPLRQAAGRSFDLIAALEAEDLTVDRDGVDVRHDALRVVEAGLRVGWRAGTRTQFSSTFEIRKGLDALGAGLRADDLTVDDRRGDFLLEQLQVTSFTRLGPSWSLRMDAFAQYSGHVLPDSERFKIGGERLGRGFEVAEIAGDRGIGAKAVLRRELSAEGSKIGRTSAYALYDIGAALKED
ncbi:MAG: ShlB/FhaC/HecB family hemolysin secretion/activation protein, partial [Myxococcota bacterium]